VIVTDVREAEMDKPKGADVRPLCGVELVRMHDTSGHAFYFRLADPTRAEAAATALNIAIRGSDEQVAALTAALAAIPGVEEL
jgi:hypothetical protein